jgi:EAL domain-containing protein (putative c-di-GMP-specific phosphodiesterase class I)
MSRTSTTEISEYVSFEPGGIVFREGESGYCAYFIERGEVEISVERNGGRVVLARRGPGELVGEMAIIDDQPRSATAVATRPCELLTVSREQITSRIARTDPVLRMCLQVMLKRFRATLSGLERSEQPPDRLEHDACGRSSAAEHAYHQSALREIKLQQELQQALRREDFELHYQPIVELRSGLTAGFEALIRWRHPERGLISPMLFIPTAEASGLIVPIGRWVLRQALKTLAWIETGVPAHRWAGRWPFISVNLSGRDFTDPDFMGHLDAALSDSGVDPRQLKLEITESLLMSEPELAVTVLEACRSKGISIAIDDFGTGYSSLSYLHRFPIDTLKIDRSFVSTMSKRAADRKIVAAIIGLAKQLKLPVVAEGIEAPGDAAALRGLGCDYGQGFLYAPPLCEADAHAFLTPGKPSTTGVALPLSATG